MQERDVMTYDVVIVGAGPAGLACAIRLKQLAASMQREIAVCVVEKGSEVGAHILSGAVLEPRALDELLPQWRETDPPIRTAAGDDRFLFLTRSRAWRLPTPPQMHNAGNFIVSLGGVCRWLATQTEALGVDLFPGFAAAELLHGDDGAVRGVATGDMGVDRSGQPTARFQRGVELHARQTVIAEGARGSLAERAIQRFHLREGVDPQTYGLGVKELWEVAPECHHLGRVVHTVGWPLDARTYGGSFLYHLENNVVAVGFVVGLDYRNPYLSPFEEFQRFKTHPVNRKTFAGGRRIAYGARALSEGGYQSIPRLTFPGGLLVGDSAGFLNVTKIKGIHTAMKSGMVAAEAIATSLAAADPPSEIVDYRTRLEQSWLWSELRSVRNIRPAFRWGLHGGIAYSALDTYFLRGKAPWTLHHHADHECLRTIDRAKPIDYPKPDGVLTFDRLSSVYLANTSHEEDQPIHLRVLRASVPVEVNLRRFGGPEQRYCPAGVYEFVAADGVEQLQINASNCVHCKTCDIKDPSQNILWTVPEGGSGPNYANM